jgi:hypothetical protein
VASSWHVGSNNNGDKHVYSLPGNVQSLPTCVSKRVFECLRALIKYATSTNPYPCGLGAVQVADSEQFLCSKQRSSVSRGGHFQARFVRFPRAVMSIFVQDLTLDIRNRNS